ncbi:peptidoglycan D,D-transpeptidase FtsI family protein [Xylanimonas oleitrophica]|uniref:peptidoglycan D,D-transpeptidase FtsI family protein n=1 Tax=Xylanimonas oleitrophica TaxID=2607479 RepID=UPI001FE6B817|nr:penicillin-binding protein 2 [Xylanimonas oleitrophica]
MRRRQGPPQPPGPPASPERRQRWLLVIATLVVVVFVARLVQVQVFEGPALAATALENRMATVVVPAHRGQITDRDGVVLATSVDRYTVAADQQAIQTFRGGSRVDAEGEPVEDGALGVAQLLAPILGTTKAELAAQLNGDRRYVVLARNVEPETQRKIRELRLQAYVPMELTSKRTYPSGTVAGPLVGFVDADQVGQGGIERAYDDVLAGKAGVDRYERSRDGVRIPGGAEDSTPAQPGGDVVLTIDHDIQWKAEDSIDEAVARTGASYGIVVVEDLRTGELMAIADSGDVDPNDRTSANVAKGSRAVQDTFEPGSTGKVITMAAALETGAWQPDSQFTVPDRFTTPNGQTFRDSHDHPVQQLTLAGILAHSSNSGTVQVAEKIPPQVQYDYLKKFGLGESTGLDLPGESRGTVHPVDRWDARTRYAVTFGQALTVNAMQATSVFSTIGNGGVRLQPTLLKGTRTADGELEPVERPEGTRVVSEETAASLLHMMEEVTSEEGTAVGAQVPGYRVAGKTGTAQIFEGGGVTYMASFIGVAPADDPRFTVSVFLKSPKTSIFGGVVAAPVFRDVMGFALQKEGVPPSSPAGEPLPLEW